MLITRSLNVRVLKNSRHDLTPKTTERGAGRLGKTGAITLLLPTASPATPRALGHFPSIQTVQTRSKRPLHETCSGDLLLWFSGILSKELPQLGVHFVGVRPGYAVWPVFHHFQLGSLDQLGGPESRRGDG